MFDDDDGEESFFETIKAATASAIEPKVTAEVGLAEVQAPKPAISSHQPSTKAIDFARRIAAAIPRIRLMPVVDRMPIMSGWTTSEFWQRPTNELIEEWVEQYGTRIDFAFVLGDDCGEGGDMVLEPDNEAGELWLQQNVDVTPVTTGTRLGFLHRHYRPDMVGRGNRIDIFGSVQAHKKEALLRGYKVELPRLPAGQRHTAEQVALRDQEMARARADIVMGPVIDLKTNGGQAMAPGGTTSKAAHFHYHEGSGPWTLESWRARPVFNPEWFPVKVWERAVASDVVQSSGDYDRVYWTMERRTEAAMRYAARMRPSVAGEGAHNAFLRNSILIVRGFDLDVQSGRRVLTYWAQQVCAHDPWEWKDIEHKLKDALEKGRERMGFKLSARRGDETAGERYAAMMRAMAEDTLNAADESQVLQDLLDESVENSPPKAGVTLAKVITPDGIIDDDDDGAVIGAVPTSTVQPKLFIVPPGGENQAHVASASSSNADDSGETQVLRDYGIDYEEVKADKSMNVKFQRVDGRATKLLPTTMNITQFLLRSSMFRGKIRKNMMTHEIEYDGKPLESILPIKFRVDSIFDYDVPKERVEDALEAVGLRNTYDPSTEEFENLPPWDGEPRLIRVAGDIIPIPMEDKHLTQVKMRRSILAMVARTLDPGCKVDTIPILIGGQGAMKSTFWRVLTGPRFFSDTALSNVSGRDEMWLISRFRVIEMAEMESMYSKAANSHLKAFFSKQDDTYRLPYSRRQITVKRRCVIVGTSNEHEILSDPTGSRRYWPIPVRGKIDITLLQKWRDQILAEAVYLVKRHLAAHNAGLVDAPEYEAGRWWMTKEEDQLREEDSKKYQEDDLWKPMVQKIINVMTPGEKFQVSDVVERMNLPMERLSRKESTRVVTILTQIGCTRHREGQTATINGVSGRWWNLPASHEENFLLATGAEKKDEDRPHS